MFQLLKLPINITYIHIHNYTQTLKTWTDIRYIKYLEHLANNIFYKCSIFEKLSC